MQYITNKLSELSEILIKKKDRRNKWRMDHLKFQNSLISQRKLDLSSSSFYNEDSSKYSLDQTMFNKTVPLSDPCYSRSDQLNRSKNVDKESISTEENFYKRSQMIQLLEDKEAPYNFDLESLNKSGVYERDLLQVLKHYSDTYWVTQDFRKQRILEIIPRTLSYHKAKLEIFKQFNIKREQFGKIQHNIDGSLRPDGMSLSLFEKEMNISAKDENMIPKTFKLKKCEYKTENVAISSLNQGYKVPLSKKSEISIQEYNELSQNESVKSSKKPTRNTNNLSTNDHCETLYMKSVSVNSNEEEKKIAGRMSGSVNKIKASSERDYKSNKRKEALKKVKNNQGDKNTQMEFNYNFQTKKMLVLYKCKSYVDKTIPCNGSCEDPNDVVEEYKKAWRVEF